MPTINPPTAGLALLALAILTVGARFLRRIPAPLIAMIVVTVVQAVFQFKGVATIGSAFGGIPRSLPALSFPSLDLARVLSLVGPAFTIALLGAIESLLSAVVGVILAALFFMRRMADSVNVVQQVDAPADSGTAELPPIPVNKGIVIFNIDGPVFFGAAEKLERTPQHIQRPATTLILRMGKWERSGVIAHVGADNVIDTLEQALARAKELRAAAAP